MGVLTLKGPVNCEDLRHEPVLPNWPQDTGSPRECELSGGTGPRRAPTSLRSIPQPPQKRETLPSPVRGENLPYCGDSLESLTLPS